MRGEKLPKDWATCLSQVSRRNPWHAVGAGQHIIAACFSGGRGLYYPESAELGSEYIYTCSAVQIILSYLVKVFRLLLKRLSVTEWRTDRHYHHHLYGVAQKWQFFSVALTSSNINRFSKLFHSQNQEKTCNNTITKDPTTPQMCRSTTLWNVNCLKSNNWKRDDFCNNTLHICY